MLEHARCTRFSVQRLSSQLRAMAAGFRDSTTGVSARHTRVCMVRGGLLVEQLAANNTVKVRTRGTCSVIRVCLRVVQGGERGGSSSLTTPSVSLRLPERSTHAKRHGTLSHSRCGALLPPSSLSSSPITLQQQLCAVCIVSSSRLLRLLSLPFCVRVRLSLSSPSPFSHFVKEKCSQTLSFV